jgi:hypothetical protein
LLLPSKDIDKYLDVIKMKKITLNLREYSKILGCKPELIMNDNIILDVEISNDLRPDWVYSNGRVIVAGFIFKDKMTIFSAEEDHDIQFKIAVSDFITSLPKGTKIYAFNNQMEIGCCKNSFNLDLRIEDMKPLKMRGGSKDFFFDTLLNKGIIKKLKLQDNFNGDGGKCIETWALFQKTKDVKHLNDIILHNFNCLIKESIIQKNKQFFLDNWIIDDKGWAVKEKSVAIKEKNEAGFNIAINSFLIEAKLKTDEFVFIKEGLTDCPKPEGETLKYYLEKEELPYPCSSCFKLLLFWEGNFNQDNTSNFLRMLEETNDQSFKKIGKRVAVAYFRKKESMVSYMNFIRKKISEYNVKGQLNWQYACQEFQSQRPDWWQDSKTFKGVRQ